MPLTMAPNGEQVIIKRIGGKDENKRHLENLGFVVGSGIVVISRLNGNMIVNIKDTRVAISETMANRILI